MLKVGEYLIPPLSLVKAFFATPVTVNLQYIGEYMFALGCATMAVVSLRVLFLH